MAEERLDQALNTQDNGGGDADRISNVNNDVSLCSSDLANLINDNVYQALKRHFLKEGKGRPLEIPKELTVTNKFLLQLYFLKEEKHHSFDKLKSWLEKLVPDTATVTEGRIRHRIGTLLNSCASLAHEDCLHLLEKEYDFHALVEPLRALGLTRPHLTGACEFKGSPLTNISNHVVIALENVRSQIREPTTFVNRWLKTLCPPCDKLTPKQLKTRVEKVVKKAKKLSKARDVVGLDAFHKCPFLVDSPIPPHFNELTCKDCDSTLDSAKNKDNLIKQLQKQNEMSSSLIQELELKSNVLEQELKSNAIEQEVVKVMATEQKIIKRENTELKSLNSKLEHEITIMKDKSRTTYKQNTLLRKQNETLESKVDLLEKEILKQKNKTSHEHLSALKRKVENEQAQKPKWKSKYCKPEDSLVTVDESGGSDSDDE